MSKAAKSLFVFGIYMVMAGLGFLSFPNIILPVFALPVTAEPWIRVVGLLQAIIGYYYIQASRQEMTGFLRLTVHVRPVVFICFIILTVSGIAKPMLILFGAIDLMGAIWTGLSLRAS